MKYYYIVHHRSTHPDFRIHITPKDRISPLTELLTDFTQTRLVKMVNITDCPQLYSQVILSKSLVRK